MNNQHILYVCTTCGEHAKNTQSNTVNQRGGEKLLERLQTLHRDWELRENFAIQAVKCMGVCERDCAVAFIAAGKRTYLFGNLPTDDSRLEDTASAVLNCAQQYHTQAEGVLSYFDRPELLKTRVLARIPPLPK
jgi:predicted metal-binding protein